MTPTRHVLTPFFAKRCLAIFIFLTILAGGAVAVAQEQVIYRFQGGSDGYYPTGALLADKAGNLYGTTAEGGHAGTSCDHGLYGCGTVFELTPPAQAGGPGAHTVLYAFKGGSDGYDPGAALVADKNGNLYSTTAAGGTGNCVEGGATGCGTIFELVQPTSPGGAWTHRVLYSFRGNPSGKGNGDGNLPSGVVFDGAGNLYGTTDGGGFCYTPFDGGPICFGTVFELAPPAHPGGAWTESVLHRFGENGDSSPHGGVILDKSGNLYGTAYVGGAYGFGGVFGLRPPSVQGGAWTERTLYDFNNTDGGAPNGSLIFDSAGNLYGTTLMGGSANQGTVFELAPPTLPGGSWTETVLYSFQSSGDGNSPLGNVIFDKAGNLYGTTWEGGSYPDEGGIVFQLAPPTAQGANWTETILHIFGTGDDGKQPGAGLIYGLDGALYGTAMTGGATKNTGHCLLDDYAWTCGVVFRIGP
jgi:uncharacterized repeat protein (TIGR03803 family)